MEYDHFWTNEAFFQGFQTILAISGINKYLNFF